MVFEKKDFLATTFGVLFLLSTTIILTYIFLFFLPTHTNHELQEEHETIMYSLLPFVNADLSFLTTNEEKHMHDVRYLGLGVLITSIISFFVIVRLGLGRAILVSNMILASIFLLSVISFKFFWDVFHKIFFPQGNWQFPQESVLITLYPQEYFFGATIIFLGLYCLVLLIVYKISFLLEKSNFYIRKKEKRTQ